MFEAFAMLFVESEIPVNKASYILRPDARQTLKVLFNNKIEIVL